MNARRDTPPAGKLTSDQIEQAYALWSAGDTLEEIATTLSCNLIDLVPWLYPAFGEDGDL